MPRTRYLKVVSCSTPTGPRACILPVAMPISRAHAELAAIGELGRGVVQHDGGIDLGEEALDGRRVLGDDRLGVVRAVGRDMRDRLVDAVDHASPR